MKTKPALITSTIVASLGGLLFGFDTAVISGTTDWLKDIYDLSNVGLGWTVAIALIGTVVGALIIGKPADNYGRKSMLYILALLFFVSAIGSAFAWDWYSFMIFRFIGGIAVGGASVVSPMYIAEISPAKIRGRLVAITQFNIVLGILLAYLSNYLILLLQLGQLEWRWMFGVEAAPAAIFFILIFFIPNSPRWLVTKNRIEDARKSLEKCGTDNLSVENELEEIQKSIDDEHTGLREKLFQKKYMKPILLAVTIALFNQLSGINAILYYSKHIFKMAGAGDESALLQSVIIGLVNLGFTAGALFCIDKFGRKVLMYWGSVGYIISLGVMAWAFYTYGTQFDEFSGNIVLVALIVFIAAHAFGQGAVIWVFLSEIFPNKVRARGQALGSFTHWIMAFFIAQSFPIIAEASGAHVFAFYGICMVGQLIWVISVMPETKGVSLENIQKHLGIK